MKFSAFNRQCEVIQARLSKIHATVQELNSEALTKTLTNSQIRKLTLLSQEAKTKNFDFEKLLGTLLNSCDDDDVDMQKITEVQEAIKDLYVDIICATETLTPAEECASGSNVQLVSGRGRISKPSNIRLPELKLVHFSGMETEWINFYNFFENTIHNNDTLSNVEKFVYLTSCLSNQPLALIKSLPLTDVNYVIARQMLIDRYQNSRLIVSSHVSSILDLPNIAIVSTEVLRAFLNALTENSNALRSLDIHLENDSVILVSVLLRKLCADLRHKFEQSRTDSKQMPTVQELVQFLESQCTQMEAADIPSMSKRHYENTIKSIPVNNTTSLRYSKKDVQNTFRTLPESKKLVLLSDSKMSTCSFCNSTGHKIYSCQEFLQLSPPNRYAFIRSKKCCTNCLSCSHRYNQCTSNHSCNICKNKHHSLLHMSQSQAPYDTQHFKTAQISLKDNNKTSEKLITCNTSSTDNNPTTFTAMVSTNTTVLLATALVSITASNGNSVVCRAVLDSAGAATFISDNIAQILRVKRSFDGMPKVCGLSSSPVKTHGITHVNISSLNGTALAESHPVIILNKITNGLPSSPITPDVKEQLKHVVLADPTFDTPANVDLLIGADLFTKTLKGNQFSLGDDMPTAMDTIFGFVLIGTSPSLTTMQMPPGTTSTLLCTNELDIHNSLQRFWLHEEPPSLLKPTQDDVVCENYFQSTHSRTENGRYIVRLPFKDDPKCLGNSSGTARKMFESLERKFETQPQYKQSYAEFMKDYLESGHMKLHDSSESIESIKYYIPHHAVFKDNKIRVVFNASSRTTTGVSLNNILYPGPKLHNDITDIIFNFRKHAYTFTCDIRQMFRQILIDDEDRKYQLIYWRDNTSQPLSEYKLSTITYGMTSSPYLANRVILQLIEDEGETFPLAAAQLRSQIYVDDALLGADSLDDALKLQNETIHLLAKGGFELRKWSSNHPELLKHIPPEHCEQALYFRTEEQPTYSLLGLKWTPNEDYFSYIIQSPESSVPTKRLVLSMISRIYDPVGMLTPVTFWVKAYMQQLWTLGLDWDVHIPPNLSNAWVSFCQNLAAIQDIKIPRHLKLSQAEVIELHGFSDASQTGYAACVYLRCIDIHQNITVQLLIAKSRVAPLKRISLPRLELCGTHLLAKILHYANAQISSQHQVKSITAWSDSTIALTWIHTPSYRLKVYVANRVTEIQDLISPHCWKHVPSSDNPADCASRGLLPHLLQDHPLWWNGPIWFQEDCSKWPNFKFTPLSEDSVPDIKTVPLPALATLTSAPFEPLARFSCWGILLRVMAYVLRFVQNCRNKTKSGLLSSDELAQSTEVICKIVQNECFSEDIRNLKNNKMVSARLRNLNPFVDENNVLRVGGRLSNSPLERSVKHPILLPKNHHVVSILIDYYHKMYLHCGPQQLQSILSIKFWIISARSIIRSRVFHCIVCHKNKPRMCSNLMGNLPATRVTPSRPFLVCGVDYAGPINIKIHTLRRAQLVKVYLCLFICFSTKAVHIEVVVDLTSEAFVAALTRFISRRGMIKEIHSDNATNFVGAARILRKCFNDLAKSGITSQFCQKQCIKFCFIPPRAPHHGGLWERAIQSAKYHLKRVIGQHILTLEEFTTLVIRVEAILNSRPLTPLSQDPSDLEALTPGHFLVGGPLTTVPEPCLTDVSLNRLRRWQIVQSFLQQIWKRWSREYLSTLQQRSKWLQVKQNLQVGELVILQEDNLPPLCWKLGRVQSVYHGKDGHVRVVQVKTSNGFSTRPITKLSVLPIEQNS